MAARFGGGGRSGLARSRGVRGFSALVLSLTVASTGLVALAAPARAAVAAPTVSGPATSPDNNTSPSWTFTSNAGTPTPDFECSLDLDGAPSSFSPCGPLGYSPPPLTQEGSYVLAVREVVAGDTADVGYSAPYVLDLTATGTAAPVADPTNAVRPQWVVTSEKTATCSVDGVAVVGSCLGTVTSPVDLGNGPHTLTVDLTDALGNTGQITASVTVDLTKPATPAPTGPTWSTVGSLSWTWAQDDAVSAQCVLIKDGVPGSPTSCSGVAGHAVTVASEGSYQLAVTLQDQAGNTSDAGTSSATTYDRTPPDAPVLTGSPAASPSNVTNPRWDFTTDPADPTYVTTCSLTSLGGGSVDLGTCTSSAQPTGLTEGTWTLHVTTTDLAGNAATTDSAPYEVDLTKPGAPAVTRPAALGNDPDPRFTFVDASSATSECRLAGTIAWAPCTESRAHTLHLTSDGTYAVEVRLTDAAGNVGDAGLSAGYTLDRTAPAAADLTSVPVLGNDPTPTYSFAVETGGSALCTVTQGAVTVDAQACDDGTYTPAALAEGSYTVTVVTRDQATNAASASRAYTLDTTAPGAPTVVSPASPSKKLHPVWSISGDPAATITCTFTTTPAVGPVLCTNGFTADLTGQLDGTYTLTVTATDAAGNTTSTVVTHEFDTKPPTAPTITGPASPGNAFSPMWTFSVPSSTTAQCRLVQGMTTGTWSGCSSGSYFVSGLADGTYTVDVLLTDSAGNDAELASSAPYVSDRTAPAAPSVSGPSGYGNNPAPSWTWTGEAGATATCRLDRAGVVGTTVNCSSGTFTPTLSGDTSYVVVVQLTDLAGNPSTAVTTPAYVLDTSVPATPLVTGPSGTNRVATVAWAFSSEGGALVECSLVRNGVAGAFGTCSSGQSVTLPSDGTYSLRVRQTDAAGNRSAEGVSADYLYDGTAPAAPVVSSVTGPSSAPVLAYSFTSEGGSSNECRVVRSGGSQVLAWAACTSPTSVDLSAIPVLDGLYVVEVRSTDAAGNVSASGAGPVYTYDTAAPEAPVVSGPAGPSTLTTPTFTWTGEAGAAARCRLLLDGVAQGSAAVPCATPYAPTLTADGQWALNVTLTDAAGNRSAVGTSGLYVLDTTPPVAPVVTAPASPGRGTGPSWSATVEAGATTECRLSSGAAVLADWASCRLPVTTDLSSRPDGTYTFSVRATDAAGLTGPAGSASYTLDTTAPAAPVFTSVPATPSRSRALSFAFTGEAGSTFVCRLASGTTVVDPDQTCTSPLPVSLTGLADGTYTVYVRAVDAAGNTGATQTATYVLDTTAPLAPVLVTGPATTAPDRRPSWVFTAETGSTLTCRLVGAATGAVVPDTTCTSPFQASLTTDDTYTFSVRATDAAGNAGPAYTGTYVLDSSAPATADVVGPASPGRSTSPTWQVSSAEGSVQCKLSRGSAVLRDWVGCGPTFTVPLGVDGLYILSSRVVDAAGNLSAEVQSRYVLDTTPPAPATLVTPSTSSDRNPSWSVASAEAGATAQCQVLGPTGVVRPFAACPVTAAGSTYNLDLTGAADGGYTLVVRLTDLAGNTGSDARGTYLLDTRAPNAVLISNLPTSPSSNVSPTWTLTGDSDAALECRLTGPGITGAVFAPCGSAVPGAGSFTAALAALADGTYTLTTRSRDAAGNLGPESTVGYELDRVAPVAPSLPVAPPSPSMVGAITWTFTVEQGASALCTLSSATAVVAAEQPCASPVPTDLATYGDGTYTLSVRAIDPAGNTSAPVTARYTYDTTAPLAPTITSEPASPSKGTSPTWSVLASEAGGRLECQLLGLPTPAWSTCTDPVVFDVQPATSGSFTLQVRQVDAAGNVSALDASQPYVLDLLAPQGPVVKPPLQSPSNSLAPAFRISLDPTDTETRSLRCGVTRVDGQASTVSPCAVTETAVVDLANPLLTTESDVELAVRSVDDLGNTSAASTALYHYDNVPPVTPQLLDLPEAHGYTDTVAWTFGSDTDTVGFLCTLVKKGTTGPVTPVTCESGDSFTLPSYGDYTFSVFGVDAAGNVSTTPDTAAYTYAPPVPQVATPRGPTAGSDETPTWTFSVPKGFTASCTLSGAGTSIETDVPCTAGTYTAPLSGMSAGTYTLVVTLSDAFGTTGKSTRSSYRFAPVAVDPGHLGQPGTPGPGPRPPVDRPVDRPTPPTPGAGPGVQPTPQVGNDPEVPRPGSSAVPRTPGKVRGLTPVVPLPAIDDVPKVVGKAIAGLGKKPTIPLLLLFVVVGFLLLQNQIDRRDPKLASAPMGAEPELDFGPVLSTAPARGGAPA